MKTACILGATGLVGNELLSQLLADNEYEKVRIFLRSEITLTHPKLEKILINFDDPNLWNALVIGDVLFSAFGTTINKAGSKEAQYKIDYTYQYQFAKAAANNGVKNYILISSAGANANAFTFYSRIKGELDQAVKQLPFKHIAILKPSFLDGDRKESRMGETIGIAVAKALSFIPLVKEYAPIHVSNVAKAMIKAEKTNQQSYRVWELTEIMELAEA